MTARLSTAARKRPGAVLALLGLLTLQALGAIAGGIGLVQDPVKNIGMPLSMLEGSPFSDYLVPGLILLVVVGLPPLAAAVGIAWRQVWAWWLALVAGAALIIWIVTEVVLLGYLPGAGIALQVAMGLLGALIVVNTLARSVGEHLGVGRRKHSSLGDRPGFGDQRHR